MRTTLQVSLAALIGILSCATAQAEQQAADPAAKPTPIPTLHCDFKAMSACTPDGDCKEGDEVAGIKIPLKATVDFESGVVAAVDESGYARADKFDGVAESGEQLIIHGIDGPYGWQLLIHKSSEAASMSFATADTIVSGFGTCSAK